MSAILIVEDDASQRVGLEEYLTTFIKGEKQTVYAAENLELARAVLAERKLDLVISDLRLPDGTGIDLVKEIRALHPELPILILTAQPTIESAVDAIRGGANDYLQKPVDLVLLKTRALQLLESKQLKEENKSLKKRIADSFSASNIIGQSDHLKSVLEKTSQVAPTDVTVLIEGESGTGKELIANVIHENSNRVGKPFIKVNCGALTKSILEAELFGATKGAYTGSDRDRQGYFEAANGGTIFLDEIGEMDTESQVRLLRVIEEREVIRVGSTKPIKVDVRLIAATNRPLLADVDSGRFREDLYYRLAVIRLQLPPLRSRRDDIPLLFNHFVTQFNERYGKSIRALSSPLLQFFQSYDWPGNIRQFRNLLEGLVVLAKDDVLQFEDLPEEVRNAPKKIADKRLGDSIQPGIAMDEYERAIIERNLSYTGGNRERAAELLGISERTLYRKLKEYGLSL